MMTSEAEAPGTLRPQKDSRCTAGERGQGSSRKRSRPARFPAERSGSQPGAAGVVGSPRAGYPRGTQSNKREPFTAVASAYGAGVGARHQAGPARWRGRDGDCQSRVPPRPPSIPVLCPVWAAVLCAAHSPAAAVAAMVFRCQRDSWARQFATRVVSCRAAELRPEGGGEALHGFEVVLEDTILFPEGGGQPDDRGLIGDIPVLRVTRRGSEAIHFVQAPLEPGAEVLLSLDWDRRFDHMQQHSGQHLITAIAEQMFGFKTTSWELGRQRSVIELDTPSMTTEQIETLERSVNEKIRQRVPVTVRELAASDPEMETVRSRGLPDDHVGPVRVVDISGVDSNMCCGTHVSNLSDLQVIKLLGTEKAKKNKTNLVFLAGNRVLKSIEQSHSIEKALTSLLKTGPGEHVEAVKRLQSSVKLLQKNNLNLLRDLAVLIARDFKSRAAQGQLFVLHRKEGDSEFMNIITNEVGTEETLLFLTVGDEKEAGLFLLSGPVEAVENLGPRVAELLGGKGAGKRGRFQGKATKMSRRGEVQALLQEFISQRSPET
ncbi:alanyl-tRNA editing protein Aarsd1-like isoform X4 [Pogoniulus pusillus]|uniref:alanyl-tRNA editing protein Aarsd1-like isoform X4 n=1 Tax=Pogoniulus pusillus TaxID=488313 RepID=UPI0030B94509